MRAPGPYSIKSDPSIYPWEVRRNDHICTQPNASQSHVILRQRKGPGSYGQRNLLKLGLIAEEYRGGVPAK